MQIFFKKRKKNHQFYIGSQWLQISKDVTQQNLRKYNRETLLGTVMNTRCLISLSLVNIIIIITNNN